MDTKKLRQKILDLAIHGKLVPQDPNDEPASVLLEHIKAEKERLIKEGKIKGSKKSAKASDTPHYPYLLPSGWKWCKLEDIVRELKYGTSEKSSSVGKITVLRMGNITDIGTIDYSNLVYSSNDEDIKQYSLKKGDLLFNRTNSSEWVGKTAVYMGEQPAIYAGYLIRVRPILISPDYLNIVMNSSYYRSWCYNVKTDAVNQSNINAQKLSKLMVPVPPLKEQKRIIVEIAKWTSLIATIRNNKEDLQAIIKQAKNKILDLAIHGKLVPQDPNDEPASKLLKRINPKAEITCDNGHSEKLPQGWYSATINDVCLVIGGVSYNKADIQDTGIRVLRGGNIQSGKVFYCSDDVFIPFSYQNKENQVQYGDIIVVASTGSQTLIGKTGFVDRDIPKTQIGAFLRIVRPKQKTLSPYIRLLFQTDAYKDYIRNVAKGSNINNVKNAHLQNYQICLPPLAEQQRIVTKIEELFSVLDNIQNALEA